MVVRNLFVILLLLIGVNSFSTIPSRIYYSKDNTNYYESGKISHENPKKNKEYNTNKLYKINKSFNNQIGNKMLDTLSKQHYIGK